MNTIEFFATTAKGVEEVLGEELRNLHVNDVRIESGGVRFNGSMLDCYKANLWLRTANRVLLPLSDFNCSDAQQLYDAVRALPWAEHLSPEMTLAVDCNLRDSAISHSGFAALKTKDAVVDKVRDHFGLRPNVDTRNPDMRINVHLLKNRCTISLDSSGSPIDRRGYRLVRREAPVRETLAGALVLLTGWDGNIPFLDPMCGSGTIAIEAAMLASGRAPGGLGRSFGFQRWKGYDLKIWELLLAEEREKRVDALAAPIIGSDISAGALSTAFKNARGAGVERLVMWQKRDIMEVEPPAAPGILLFNPPYGERLGDVEELKPVYRRIGDFLKQRCTGYTAYVLAGNPELAKFIGLKAARRIVLFNGPIECRLLKYELY